MVIAINDYKPIYNGNDKTGTICNIHIGCTIHANYQGQKHHKAIIYTHTTMESDIIHIQNRQGKYKQSP